MKILKKRWVAVLLAILMIAAAVAIGRWKSGPVQPPHSATAELDTTLATQAYETWIWDEAEVLSDRTEQWICTYNANWDSRYSSLVAIAAVEQVEGDLADYAYDLGNEIGLGENDAILVMDIGNRDVWLATGTRFADLLDSGQVTNLLDDYLYDDFMARDYDNGVLSLYAALNEVYVAAYGAEQSAPQVRVNWAVTNVAVWAVIVLVLLLVVCSFIDNVRYAAYHRRYYGMGTPPVVFRPILFWHGPGYGWYRRRWNRPPPPPPGSGPRRPGGFGGGSRGGGFSPPRGGGFGSSRGGGGFSRGGGFGSSRSGGGFSRGGGFGSSRGGGGFSRGGGFSGGRRGGGFGRR